MKTLWLGDLSPTVNTNPFFERKDINTLFSDVVTIFQGNDVNFVNLECVLTESKNKIEKFGPHLKASVNVADTLKMLGVNYCGVSNNHFFDYGIQGTMDTLQALENAGIGYTGFGSDYEDSRKNLVIETEKEKIAVIAVCEHEYSYALEDRMGCRPYDEYDTIEDIRQAKEKCNRVIVIYHGGKEHCQYPSPRLYKLCRAMVRNGADVVLCQHSHCIGCYEQYEGGHILYGQGNFHFVKPDFLDKDLEKTWNNSLAVKYDTENNAIEFIPLVVRGNGVSLAKDQEKKEIMEQFAKRNRELKEGKWRERWHSFCESMKECYFNAIKIDPIFGHYLDCEAHTDVWRELFQTANMRNEREREGNK